MSTITESYVLRYIDAEGQTREATFPTVAELATWSTEQGTQITVIAARRAS